MINFFDYVANAAKEDFELEYEIDQSHNDARWSRESALELLNADSLERFFTEYVSNEWLDKNHELSMIRSKLKKSMKTEIRKVRMSYRHSILEIFFLGITLIIEGLIIYSFHGDPRYELSCLLSVIGIFYAPFHFFYRLNYYLHEKTYHVLRAQIFSYSVLLIDMYFMLGHAEMMKILESRHGHRSSPY